MSELANVVDQVKKGARKLEWITRLAEALEDIGSIQQAAEEAAAQEITARKALADIEEAVTKKRKALKDLEAKQDDMLNKARSELEAHKAEAEQVAESYKKQIEDAKERAFTIVSNAEEAAEVRAKAMDTLLNERRKELLRVEEQITESLTVLDDIEKQIVDAKAKARALFKGLE